MKLAFSQPTSQAEEQRLLFSRYRTFGYTGLQLKHSQYRAYVKEPERFLEQWGAESNHLASGLIAGGPLDDEGVASLRAVFAFAHAVGSERIIFCHDHPRQGVTPSDIQSYAKKLSELGKEAQQHGVVLSLHHHYNQPVMYRQDFAVFFDAVSDQTVKLTVDTAHLAKSGISDIAGIIHNYQQVIDNLHIKDFADGTFMLLGQGTIDFGPVFEALKKIDYRGWLCADEESGSDCLTAMETCAHFFRKRGS